MERRGEERSWLISAVSHLGGLIIPQSGGLDCNSGLVGQAEPSLDRCTFSKHVDLFNNLCLCSDFSLLSSLHTYGKDGSDKKGHSSMIHHSPVKTTACQAANIPQVS